MIANPQLKTNGRGDKRLNFDFYSKSALIVSKQVVVACGTKSYLGLAEMSAFLFLV